MGGASLPQDTLTSVAAEVAKPRTQGPSGKVEIGQGSEKVPVVHTPILVFLSIF